MGDADVKVEGNGAETAAAEEPHVYPLSEPLPDVLTRLSHPGVVARLDKASRRGRLPGFHKNDPEGICSVDAFGDPFDKTLIVIGDKEPDGRTRLRWRLRLKVKIPAILAGVLAFTVWPGEPLTNSLLVTWFPFYNEWVNPAAGGKLRTWMWYLPMAILSAMWVWHYASQKSKRTTHQSAHETVRKICNELGGDLVKAKFRR